MTLLSDPPILQVRGLVKRFGALEVLKGIDFAVAAQELVFVIGPSGSGKSTLLRCCNRLEEPDGGSIRVDGAPLRQSARRGASRSSDGYS